MISFLSPTILLTLSTLLLYIKFSQAFNLEPRLPVIKLGQSGSYFGYSVAQHQVLNENKKVIENVLLIGAPKARPHWYATNDSGAVYRCSVSTDLSCRQLEIEPEKEPPLDDVLRDDQWLGVTVKSQGPGGYVMTCAHRYIKRGDDYQWGQGLCYSMKQNLEYHRPWEPCLNRPVNKAHEQFGYCQAGTSGIISQDNDIVIGTPGPFTWRGTVFTNSIRFSLKDDRAWYMGPLLDEKSPVDKYSYLGMSVTSGKFFNNETSYVAGAPRAEGTGQVVFFTKQKSETVFVVQLILQGVQFASSFGYSLTSMDFNGDGYLDLIVGAPFFYEKGKGGAVYLYTNSREGIRENTEPSVLNGKPESRFGFAMASIGDLNKDGYLDLAIGAPYEEEGVVYIYLGSKDGIMEEPSQVIHGEDVPHSGLSTFGYSLDGGMDLDNNGYPDILVGAYSSDAAILLRSRPVLDIITSVTGKLTNIDPDSKGCEEDRNSQSVCFSFMACFQLNSVTADDAIIRLQYRIEAETFTGRKYYRVKFNSSINSETPNIVEKEIAIKRLSFSTPQCSTEVVYLKDKSDIQNPIKFKLTYSLIQKTPSLPRPGESLPNINQFPILNQQEASKVFEAKFLKDCGSNDICESDLNVMVDINLKRETDNIPVFYLGEKQVILSVKVANRKEPAYDSMLYVTHPTSLSYVGRTIVKGDGIECSPVNKSLISCELGNPLKKGEVEVQLRLNPRTVSDEETTLQFSVKANTTSVEVSHQDDIVMVVQVVRVAEVEIRGVSSPEQVFYGGDLKEKGEIKYEDDIGSEVIHTYEIINHGPWWAKNVEVVVSWPYEEANTYNHDKWLLYMTEAPKVQGNGFCQVNDEFINPYHLKKRKEWRSEAIYQSSDDTQYQRRLKREVAPQELRTDGKTFNVVTLDCEKDTAECFRFSCYFPSLDRDQTGIIKIYGRLWNSTFVKDYPTVDWVSVLSRAYIKFDPSFDVRQKEENDFAFAETKAYPDIPAKAPEGIPLWIIILSVCAGVLLLVILILILWKCGFFKRKKPGYILAANSDTEKDY